MTAYVTKNQKKINAEIKTNEFDVIETNIVYAVFLCFEN